MNFNEAIKIFTSKRQLEKKGGSTRGMGLYQDEKILRNFAVFVRNCPIEDVTSKDVVEWLNLFKEMGYEEGTLKNRAQALIQFFKEFKFQKLEVLDYFVIPKIRVYHQTVRICNEDNYQKLLEAAPIIENVMNLEDAITIRNRFIISLIWNTGMRRSELANLNISSLDKEKNLITIRTAKSRGMRPLRQLPINTFDNKAVEVMPIWLGAREKIISNGGVDSEALFISCNNQFGGDVKRIGIDNVSRIFMKVSKKAGLGEVSNAHSLRHNYGHTISNKLKVNNSVISTAMGHSSLASSYRYTQPGDAELLEILKPSIGA